ncbi:hypothetical protein JD551_13035 [Aeromonas caviae]|uniref:hypothetical protein n=1 Tax=Aeromonas caviae TaxID=648 RepID=UPI00191CC6B1|nr:hypothetical protein [Aeromonas caviae]MBL0549957.1 hypothetical protein [Aeromonas caviae]
MFVRRDPFLQFVSDDIIRKKTITQDFNILEQEYGACGDNFYEKIVIACTMKELYPDRIRGYLISYDALSFMGFSEDASNIIDEAGTIFEHNIGYAVRIIDRMLKTYRFSDVYAYINPRFEWIAKNAKGNNNLANILRKFYEITKDHSALDSLSLSVDNSNSTFTFGGEGIYDYSLQNDFLRRAFSADERDTFENAVWFYYRAGNRTYDFFCIAICELSHERFLTPRVMFFKLEAYKYHPNICYFFEKAFQCAFNRCDLVYALDIFKSAIRYIGVTDSIIHAGLKLSALGCKTGLDSDFSWVDKLNKFSASHNALSRSYFSAMWNGRRKEALDIEQLAVKNMIKLPRTQLPVKRGKGIKVAVCFSGQLRGGWKDFVSSANSYINKLNADIFADLWDESVLAPPRFAQLNRYFGELVHLLPKEYQTASDFSIKFPRTFKKLTTKSSKKIDLQFFQQSIDNVKIRLHSSVEFDQVCEINYPKLKLSAGYNQAKMFFLLREVFKTLTIHEIEAKEEYDVVIRCRPDMNIELDSMNKFIDAVRVDRNLVYTTYLSDAGFGDQFAIGSREAMEIYSEVWDRIAEQRNFRYMDYFDPLTESRAAEELLAAHLITHGIDVRVIRPRRSLFSAPVVFTEINVYEELNEDIQTLGDKRLFDFLTSYEKLVPENIKV